MPTSFLSADTNFPRLTADQPVEERLGKIQNYLYMLLEELRYTLSNLGEENLNEKTLAELGETLTGGISSTVSDLAGNVSTLEQTAASLTTRVSDAEGNITSLQQTSTSITARLNNVDGDNTTIEAFATGTKTTVSNLAGDVSTVSQTADKINWVVASGTSKSDMTLTSEAIDLVAQGINISGYVTLQSIEDPQSKAFINGNNILLKSDSTGSSGSQLTLINNNDHGFGGLCTMPTSSGDTNQYKNDVMLTLEAYGIVDEEACGLLLESGANIVAHGRYINLDGQNIVLTPSRTVMIEATYQYPETQSGFYSFCSDGIYYGNQRIVTI